MSCIIRRFRFQEEPLLSLLGSPRVACLLVLLWTLLPASLTGHPHRWARLTLPQSVQIQASRSKPLRQMISSSFAVGLAGTIQSPLLLLWETARSSTSPMCFRSAHTLTRSTRQHPIPILIITG